MNSNKNQCYFCEKAENLIHMDTNSLIIGAVYIDFAQLISEVIGIKIEDEPNNMICTPCKDLLSQFYVMKQQASTHRKPSDIRKKQILDLVVDFIEATTKAECIVSKYSNLLAIHPDTSNSLLTEHLQSCNDLIESEGSLAIEEEEIVDDIDIKTEHFETIPQGYELEQYDDSVDNEMKEFIVEFPLEDEEFEEVEEFKIFKALPQRRPKTYQKSNLDSKQKEWLRKELKQSVVFLDTPLGTKTQWCCKQCTLKSFSSENAFRLHLKFHLENADLGSENLFNSKAPITADDQNFLEQKLWIQQQLQSQKNTLDTNDGLKSIWSCSQCDFVAQKRGTFRQHLQKAHTSIMMRGPNKHSCYECRLRFDGESHLIVHKNCHKIFDVIAPYAQYPQCEPCKMIFASNDYLQIHTERHKDFPDLLYDMIPAVGVVHRNGESFVDDLVQEIHASDAPTCGHCLLKFATDTDCKHHIMIYHATSFTCPFDLRVFDGIPTLSFGNHLRQCHPNIFPDLQIACSFCKMQFETVYDKLAHMKSCQAKMFQCDHCEKSFFRKAELLHHLKVVTGLMVFACHVCGKRCKDQGDLKTHHRSHTNIRPYQCPHCDKAYKTSSARASHVESHMEQTHVCNICNVKFRRRILYQRHMKLLHDEAYRQKCFAENTCNVCNKSYLRRTHYKNHLKTHK